MSGLTNREFVRDTAPLLAGGLGGLFVAYVVASPSAPRLASFALLGALLLLIALTVPPHVFIAAGLLVVGVSTAFASPVLTIGPVAFYVSDLAVLSFFARGVIPRPRYPGDRALAGLPQALFLLWLFIMTVAGVRAILAGFTVASVVRNDLALFYWPLLYFGFTRVLAERNLDKRLLWRNLAIVAVGFALYMFVARALNHPFQDPGLAQVPTGPNQTVPRNFGFASAFTIYPILAIAGVALMANTRDPRARWRWTALAAIGLIATLTTLVRGTIYSLALGVLLVLWLSSRGAEGRRARTAVQLAVAAGVAVLAVLAVAPKLGQAVIQRSLPFTHQATGAVENADYRFKAMGSGIRVARTHPTGLGVIDEKGLIERDIDPGYLVHSGFATLLVYGGWFALLAGGGTVLMVIRRSFQRPSESEWLHPAFVGAITMLCIYTLSAAGLAGDSWVVPLGALVVALRFGVMNETR